jgi:hypothetical protein
MWLFDVDGYQAISTDIDEMGPLTLGVREVAGSNPATPTNRNRGFVAQ